MDLIIRLDILKNSRQISESNYKKIIQIIKLFEEKRNIKLTEENGAMFVTHLAIALTRIENGNLVNKIDEMIFDEIVLDTNYEKSVEITNDIEKIIGDLPKQERDFIEMHICTLINN